MNKVILGSYRESAEYLLEDIVNDRHVESSSTSAVETSISSVTDFMSLLVLPEVNRANVEKSVRREFFSARTATENAILELIERVRREYQK